jgi:hypothetical protein
MVLRRCVAFDKHRNAGDGSVRSCITFTRPQLPQLPQPAVSELRLKWDRFRAAGARRVLSFRDQTKAFLFSHWQMLVAFMLIL